MSRSVVLHAADLHLDAMFEGIGRTPPHIAAARRGVALPLVMDDELVLFDPERVRGMAGVLAAFARAPQVLFFACHPSTRDLLVQHGGGPARLIEL